MPSFLPLLGFYWKHNAQINALLSKGSVPGQSSLLLDVATAMAPVVKKHWPQLNTDNLIDDGVATLKEVFATPAST